MGQIILILIGLIITTIGVICTYDARVLSKKFFSFGDQNQATTGMKIVGFFLSMIGAIVIIVNM